MFDNRVTRCNVVLTVQRLPAAPRKRCWCGSSRDSEHRDVWMCFGPRSVVLLVAHVGCVGFGALLGWRNPSVKLCHRRTPLTFSVQRRVCGDADCTPLGSSLICLSGAGSSALLGTRLGSGAVPGCCTLLCVQLCASPRWYSSASHVALQAEWRSWHTAVFQLMLLTFLKLLSAVDSWNQCGFSFANRKFLEMVLMEIWLL